MSNDPVKSKSGVFVDSKSGEVVYSEPEEGVQIVAPGGVVDANARARIELEGGSLESASTADVAETADSAVAVKTTDFDALKVDEKKATPKKVPAKKADVVGAPKSA